MDNELTVYDQSGGLEKITQRDKNTGQYNAHSIFDGTIDRYTAMIHEDEKEINHTGKLKKIQYRDTIAFERILKKLFNDKKYRIKGIEKLS